jgi:AcrR family transcriptional regulator
MKREAGSARASAQDDAAPATRREIQDAAKNLIAVQGYASTTVRQIARKVAIKAGSLYYHYGGKDEILFSIFDEGNRRLLEAADRIVQHRAEDAASLLRRLIREHMRVLAADPAQFMVVTRELSRLKGARRQRIMAQREQYEKIVQNVLDRGIREGAFRACDVKLVSFGIIAMLNGVAYWFSPQGKLSVDDIAKEYSRVLLDGLKA